MFSSIDVFGINTSGELTAACY